MHRPWLVVGNAQVNYTRWCSISVCWPLSHTDNRYISIISNPTRKTDRYRWQRFSFPRKRCRDFVRCRLGGNYRDATLSVVWRGIIGLMQGSCIGCTLPDPGKGEGMANLFVEWDRKNAMRHPWLHVKPIEHKAHGRLWFIPRRS